MTEPLLRNRSAHFNLSSQLAMMTAFASFFLLLILSLATTCATMPGASNSTGFNNHTLSLAQLSAQQALCSCDDTPCPEKNTVCMNGYAHASPPPAFSPLSLPPVFFQSIPVTDDLPVPNRACTCIHHEGCRADSDCDQYHVHCPKDQSMMCQQMDPFWRNNVCICVTKPEGGCNCDHTACDWGQTKCDDDGCVPLPLPLFRCLFLSSFRARGSRLLADKKEMWKEMPLPPHSRLCAHHRKRQASGLQASVDALPLCPLCHDALLLAG